jgi:fructose-bisphosphate aldolase class 1
MSTADLALTAQTIVADGKGILAADETPATLTRRFDAQRIASTPDGRRAYRELLFTTRGIAEYIGGVILQDETIRQHSSTGTPFPTLLAQQGIIPGTKVDAGAKPLAGCPGERVTEGLDGLVRRLEEYYALGARFAKWRAVIVIGDGLPKAAPEEVAAATVRCLRQHAPAAIPGIVFLSGGQDHLAATQHLNLIDRRPGPKPWTLSFSYGRALQDEALTAWAGSEDNVAAAQQAFYHRARCDSAAALGGYSPAAEAA